MTTKPLGLTRPRKFLPTAQKAIKAAREAGLDADFKSAQTHSKGQYAVLGRRMVWYILRDSGMSLPQCGRATGGHDHTTVMNGLKNIEEFVDMSKLHAACLLANLPRRAAFHARRVS